MKQYNKSENKWKKYLKATKKQNKMVYSIANQAGSRRELKNIKRIRAKASKNCKKYIRNYSIEEYYFNYSLSINIS